MNKIKLFSSLLLFTIFFSFNHLKDNPYITFQMKSQIIPHMLPESHPLMSAMDDIFMSKRVTASMKNLREAGFSVLFSQPRSQIRVVRHPNLPNHLIKLTLDTNPELKQIIPDWEWLVKRCVGANKIRQIIEEKNLTHVIVPKKWLYVLPAKPEVAKNTIRKVVVLLVEEMQLVDEETNSKNWKNAMTKAHLNELFTVMSYGGGGSGRPDNVWFTKDGKLAFIDTEYPDLKANYGAVRKYLSPQNRAYWTKLMLKYGKE